MFDSIKLTMKYFFDVLEMTFAGGVYVNKVDGAGAIGDHPTAMSEARDLGRRLCLSAAGGGPWRRFVCQTATGSF